MYTWMSTVFSGLCFPLRIVPVSATHPLTTLCEPELRIELFRLLPDPRTKVETGFEAGFV
jgi:hypothetical protein